VLLGSDIASLFFLLDPATVFGIVGIVVTMLRMRAFICVISDRGWRLNVNMMLTEVSFAL